MMLGHRNYLSMVGEAPRENKLSMHRDKNQLLKVPLKYILYIYFLTYLF